MLICFADVFLWTNERVIAWLNNIGLREYSTHLSESGVHGALMVLDESFDHTTLALLLQIPNNSLTARQTLERELRSLLYPRAGGMGPGSMGHGPAAAVAASLVRRVIFAASFSVFALRAACGPDRVMVLLLLARRRSNF